MESIEDMKARIRNRGNFKMTAQEREKSLKLLDELTGDKALVDKFRHATDLESMVKAQAALNEWYQERQVYHPSFLMNNYPGFSPQLRAEFRMIESRAQAGGNPELVNDYSMMLDRLAQAAAALQHGLEVGGFKVTQERYDAYVKICAETLVKKYIGDHVLRRG